MRMPMHVGLPLEPSNTAFPAHLKGNAFLAWTGLNLCLLLLASGQRRSRMRKP